MNRIYLPRRRDLGHTTYERTRTSIKGTGGHSRGHSFSLNRPRDSAIYSIAFFYSVRLAVLDFAFGSRMSLTTKSKNKKTSFFFSTTYYFFYYVLLMKTVKEERNSLRKGRRREPKEEEDVLMTKLPIPQEKKAPPVTGRPIFILAKFG